MEYEGAVTVPAERAAVWDPVTDPEALTACVMGAEAVTRVSEREYEGVVRQSLAGITVEMEGSVRITDLDPPERLRFTGTGRDDRTGSRMDADVEVLLRDGGEETTPERDADGTTPERDADGTVLEYRVDVEFTGKLATLGSRVLRRQVKANIDTYFDNLVAHVEGRS